MSAIVSEGIKVLDGPFDSQDQARDWLDNQPEDYAPQTLNPKVVNGFDGKWYICDTSESDKQVFSHLDPRTNNVDNFKTGTKVEVKDPVWFDEIRNGFVAKQLDDRHFLVKLDMPFTRTNPQSEWLEVSRDYAHQTVKEI